MQLRHQDRLSHRHNTMHHRVLRRDRDVLLGGNSFDSVVETNSDQGVSGRGAEQRCGEEPEGRAACGGGCVSEVEEACVRAEVGFFEGEEAQGAGGADVAEGAGAAGGVAGETEPDAI